MAYAIAAIRCHGWLSKGKAYTDGGTPTATRVSVAMEFARCEFVNENVVAAEMISRGLTAADLPTEADFEAATSKLEELSVILDRMESEGSTNDYTQALRILSVAGTVNRKAMGIAVSAVSFVAREVAPKAATTVSNYVGSVGEKITVKASLVSANKLGTGSTLLTFTTSDGNVLKYFANGPVSVVEGSVYEVAGKVKAHQEFRGRKETMLNYAKVNS